MHDLYMWYLNTVSLPMRTFLYNVVTAIDIILRYILLFIMFILHTIYLIHIPLIVIIIGGGLMFIAIYTYYEHNNIPQLIKDNSRDTHLLNDVIFARKVFEPDEQKHNGVFESKLKKRLKFVIIKDLFTIVLAVIMVLTISKFTPNYTYTQLKNRHDYYAESINKYKIVSDNSLTFVGLMMTNDHFNADPNYRMLDFVNKKYPVDKKYPMAFTTIAFTIMANQYQSANEIIKKNGKDQNKINHSKKVVAKIKEENKIIDIMYNNTNDKTNANKLIYDLYALRADLYEPEINKIIDKIYNNPKDRTKIKQRFNFQYNNPKDRTKIYDMYVNNPDEYYKKYDKLSTITP